MILKRKFIHHYFAAVGRGSVYHDGGDILYTVAIVTFLGYMKVELSATVGEVVGSTPSRVMSKTPKWFLTPLSLMLSN